MLGVTSIIIFIEVILLYFIENICKTNKGGSPNYSNFQNIGYPSKFFSVISFVILINDYEFLEITDITKRQNRCIYIIVIERTNKC